MESSSLDILKNKTVIKIYKISINENNSLYNLSDTLLLKLVDGSFFQIVVDYDIKVYPLSSIEKLVILGDYDLKNIEIELVEISEVVDSQKIIAIYDYSQSTYHFGSKFLNAENEFIFGFCFGWDEIILLNEKDFITMLNSYENRIEIKNIEVK